MLLLVDLDGVVYRGPRPVPGVARVLTRRVRAGDAVRYVTNNSRWHRSQYEARLRALGAPVSPDCVVSSARATALALRELPALVANGLVMVLGGPGLAQELRDVGLRTVAPTERGLAAAPACLVVGVDFALTYRRLSIAAAAVRAGASFVATNRDHIYPTEDGFTAGAGTLVAAVATAVEREPDLVVGKPEPRLFETAAHAAGVPPEQAVVIGDGLMTDIMAANRLGARSVLMLTGVSSEADLAVAPPERRPTVVARDAAELERRLRAFAAAA